MIHRHDESSKPILYTVRGFSESLPNIHDHGCLPAERLITCTDFLHSVHNLVASADDFLFSHGSPTLYLIHFGLLGLVQPSRNF